MKTWVSSFRAEEIWAWKKTKGEDKIDDSLVGVGNIWVRAVSRYEPVAGSVAGGWGFRFLDKKSIPLLLRLVGRKL